MVVWSAFFGLRQNVEDRLTPFIPNPVLSGGIASLSTSALAALLSNPFAKMNVLMQGDTTNAFPSTWQAGRAVFAKGIVKGFTEGAHVRSAYLIQYLAVLRVLEKVLPDYMPSLCFEEE